MYQEEENSKLNEQETVANEEVKEEVPQEASVEEKPVNNPEDGILIARRENISEVTEEIESKRQGLLVMFNRTKKYSRILMTIVVIAVIGAIIMIFNNLMVLKIIGYSLAGVVLVAMVIYYMVSKNKFPNASKEYIKEVTRLISEYDFDDPRFTEVRSFPDKKLNRTDLEVDRVYCNSNDIGSRNFIKAKFDGKDVEISENVLYSNVPGRKNQRSVVFLGKYVSLENDKKFDGRFIFNLKGNPEKLVDQPNDIEDCKVLLEEEGLVVYSSNDKSIKEVFGTKFISKLKEIRTDDKLLNFVMVFWAGHTAIYMSYDDSVTVLPFEHPFNLNAQDKYKADLVAALELATLEK